MKIFDEYENRIVEINPDYIINKIIDGYKYKFVVIEGNIYEYTTATFVCDIIENINDMMNLIKFNYNIRRTNNYAKYKLKQVIEAVRLDNKSFRELYEEVVRKYGILNDEYKKF